MRSFIFSISVILFSAMCAHAEIGGISFEEIVGRSDIVVEGQVIDQKNQTTEEGGFKFFRVTHLKVDKVFKGDVKENDTIEIYNGSNFFYDISVLDISQHYILCLKHHQNGFRDAYYGRGQWLIDNSEGVTYTRDALKGEKRIYAEFIEKLMNVIKKNSEKTEDKKIGWF
jgi:hypothetical protein